MDGCCDIQKIADDLSKGYHAAICLCWLSDKGKNTLMKSSAGVDFYWLEDIVGSEKEWVRESCRLTESIINGSPVYRTFPIRGYIAEDIYYEYLISVLSRKVCDLLCKLLRNSNLDRIEVHTVLTNQLSSGFSEMLKAMGEQRIRIVPAPASPDAKADQLSRMPFVKRMTWHAKSVVTLGNYKEYLWDVFIKLDSKYELRNRIWNYKKKDINALKKITFFSSYLNNSKALKAYEPLMPFPIEWVVNNYYAKLGVMPGKAPIYWLWGFGDLKGNKVRRETDSLSHPGGDKETVNIDRDWLSGRTFWRTWNDTLMPGMLALMQFTESYFKANKPGMVAVANQAGGIEACFTHYARKNDIPVLQVLHGILSDHWVNHQPVLTDGLIVPGEFWMNLWPASEHKKMVVFNPPGQFQKVKKKPFDGKKNLTFFSWPLHKHYSYNYAEFMDGFIHLFHKMIKEKKCRITIRFHPSENPSDFKERWEMYCGSLPGEVSFSKFEPLAEVLQTTDVALMYRSTVMLDCMTNQIPVIMPGWVDFWWKRDLDDVPDVYVAAGFQEIEDCLLDWLKQPPEPDASKTARFVQVEDKNQQEFKSFIQKMLS